MEGEHIDAAANELLLVKVSVKATMVHHHAEEVDLVQKNLHQHLVFCFLHMLVEVVRNLLQHCLELGALLEQLFIVGFLRQKHRDADKVQEAQTLVCMLKSSQDEVENLVDFVNFLRPCHDVLQVQQMGEDLQHFVPDSLRVVLDVRRVDVHDCLCDAAIDFLKILRHQ